MSKWLRDGTRHGCDIMCTTHICHLLSEQRVGIISHMTETINDYCCYSVVCLCLAHCYSLCLFSAQNTGLKSMRWCGVTTALWCVNKQKYEKQYCLTSVWKCLRFTITFLEESPQGLILPCVLLPTKLWNSPSDWVSLGLLYCSDSQTGVLVQDMQNDVGTTPKKTTTWFENSLITFGNCCSRN